MKKNNLLTFILVSLLVFSLLFVFACKPPVDDTPDPQDEDEITQGSQLITNGTFASGTNAGGTNEYLKDTVNGWTKTNGATYYSNAVMGVVDLGDKDKFDSNIKVFYEDGIAFPKVSENSPKDEDGNYTDTNALMVALPQEAGSVYYRNTSAITLTANKYYKLSIDVYTSLLGEEGELQGAWLIVNNSIFAEFKSIDTDSTWQTYEVYIEANNFENRTFYVELWLGYGPKYLGTSNEENLNPRLTQGFAFFDNVLLEEVEKEVFTTEYVAAGKKDKIDQEDKKAVLSLYYTDPGFTYETKYSFISPGSTTSKFYYSTKSGSPQNYKMVVGKTDAVTTSEFPSYSGASGSAGIFDLSKLYTYDEDAAVQYTDAFALLNTADAFKAPRPEDFYTNGVFKNLPGELDDTEALLIYHPNYNRSGLGFTSNQSYLIEKGKYYEISVWVYVWTPKYGKEFKEVEPTEPSDPRPELPLGEDATEEEKNNATAWENYDIKLAEYEDAQENFEKDKAEYYAAAANSTATFKLTGASIKEGGISTESDPALASFYTSDEDEGSNAAGSWQKLSVRIQGNELSDRKVNFEFWYGEGEWGSDTLKVGGAIFDNISIKVDDEYPGTGDYEVLSQIQKGDYSQFGLDNAELLDGETVFREFGEDGSDLWDFSFEDKNSDPQNATAGYVAGAAAKDAEVWENAFPELPLPGAMSVTDTENNEKILFNLIMLYNKEYTSTKLVYADGEDDGRTYININPNTFYRLSIWVRTDNIDDSFGLTVNLLDDKNASLSSLANINTDSEWQELTFFLRGSTFKENKAYVEFKLGSGNIVTPTNHIKGAAYATAITYQTVSYTEYNAAVAGTYSAKKAISDTPSTTNSITNGLFAELNTTNYDDKKDGERIFDDNGKLIGVAVPASWTLSSGATSLPAPTNVKIDDGYLKWDKVEHAEDYYVYMDGVKLDDNITKNNVLIHKTGSGDINQYQIDLFRTGSFKVRAVRNTHGNPYEDGDNYIPAGISPYSTSVTNTLSGDNKDYDESLEDLKTRFGIIDYKNYSETKDIADEFYPDASSPEKLAYKSHRSDYLLMLNSDYYTRGGYTSSSISLSANSYYILGVWVKTEGGAEASVTINNTSKVFAAKTYDDHNSLDGDYTGYVNINTDGEWVEYRFYIETTVSSASLQLELFLGDKYAEGNKITEDGKTTTYPRGLSKGTVYFDDVSFISVASKDEFEKLAYGGNPDDLEADEIRKENTFANLDELEGFYFENQYIFKLLDYTTDSFDIYTVPDADDINGGKPQDYTHYTATAASDYDSSAEEPAMLYGVYDKRKTSSPSNPTVEAITNSGAIEDATAEDIAAFLSEAMGNNYLLLANLIDNGQYYLSGTSITLTGNSYYKVTFFAKTWIPEGKYGEFRFEYGNEVGKYSTIKITSEGKSDGLHQYSFYVANSSSDSISGNKLSFYLGSNTETVSDATPTDFFKGLMIIDNISVVKLADAEEYDLAVLAWDDLDEAGKLSADFAAHEFVAKETDDTPITPPEDEEEAPRQISSEVWMLIASIVIGAVLIAVIVVLTWRKISKKIKRAPAKVISNVPVNMTTAEQRKAQGSKKKDISSDDEFQD